MGKRLTNEDIDQRLIGRNIKRLEDYPGQNNIKINWFCLIESCNNCWKSMSATILNGSGCPKCSGNLKLTNEDIDSRLIGRNIKRIDNYTSSTHKIMWECLINNCGHFWKTTADSILNANSGCPKCSGKLKLTNEIIDQKLLGRNIKRIDDYINAITKINWECLIGSCNYQWKTKPFYLLNNNSGCPKCAGTAKLSNEIIDKRLMGRNIERLDNCLGSRAKIRWKCLVKKCSHIWIATPSSVLTSNTGCPKCSDTKLNNEIIDQKLIGKNIKRIDNYINNASKIHWQCLVKGCHNIWEATSANILNGDGGCPLCLHKNEKIIFRILTENNINFEYQKNIKLLNFLENKNYKVDFYFPLIKLIIEYNGAQHYDAVQFYGISKKRADINLEKQKIRDQYIRNFCISNNIKIIEIDGRDYSFIKLENFIINNIIPIINSYSL